MLLSNHLIYEGRLKCGSEKVGKQSLTLSNRKTCNEMHVDVPCGKDCWIQVLMEKESVKL